MAQYTDGTVNLTNASATVTGDETLWLANAAPGNYFVATGIDAEDVVYEIASVDDNVTIQLTAPFVGTTGGARPYVIHRDFDPNGLPLMGRSDTAVHAVFNRWNVLLQQLITAAAQVQLDPNTINVVERYNAVGDGVTDNTAAIQQAIDDAPDGGEVLIPVGRFGVTKIAMPPNKSIRIRGVTPNGSRVFGLTPGSDVFCCDANGVQTQNRFQTVHEYKDLGIEVNVGAATDFTPNFNRCTARGFPVAAACIAYASDHISVNLTGNVNAAWRNSFGRVDNCILELVNVNTAKNDLHGCVGMYFGGTCYGWSFHRVRCHGVHWALAQSAPFLRRCTANAAADTLNYTLGTGFAYPNDAEVYVLAHTAAGTETLPFVRGTDYFVVNSTPGQLQISETLGGPPVDITAAGSAPIFIAPRDSYSGVIAPDGITIDDITHYNGKGTISMITPEGLRIGRVDAYNTSVSGLEIVSWDSGSRDNGISVKIDGPYYTESPQSSTLLATDQEKDPFIFIDMRGGQVDCIQFRGETPNVTRPRMALYGIGYEVQGLRLLSSASQAQPDVYIYGDGIGVFGQGHPQSAIVDQGNNNYYLLKSDADGLVTASHSPFRQRLPVTAPIVGARTVFPDSTNPLVGPVQFNHDHIAAAAGDALEVRVIIKGTSNLGTGETLGLEVDYAGQPMFPVGNTATFIQGGAATIRAFMLGGADLAAPAAGINQVEVRFTSPQDIQCIAVTATDLENVSRVNPIARGAQSISAVDTDQVDIETIGNQSLILGSIALLGDAAGPITEANGYTKHEDGNTGGGSATTDVSFMLASRVWPVAAPTTFGASWPLPAARTLLAVEYRGLDLV